jgi:ParB/RepB/Spo0J family partition protein|nr:MAG TPA_asm: ParB protein [Caudoviricetes sp.]
MNTKNSKENLALKLAKDYIEVEQIKPLQITYVKVDDIYPNDYNPNTHDADSFDLLIKSLLYFGFTQPIVVNRSTMQIVDGENRYRAACVIGYEMVPVCFVDFDEEKQRYATIMHNAARGHNNNEMMNKLEQFLDSHFKNSVNKVLLKDRQL